MKCFLTSIFPPSPEITFLAISLSLKVHPCCLCAFQQMRLYSEPLAGYNIQINYNLLLHTGCPQADVNPGTESFF